MEIAHGEVYLPPRPCLPQNYLRIKKNKNASVFYILLSSYENTHPTLLINSSLVTVLV